MNTKIGHTGGSRLTARAHGRCVNVLLWFRTPCRAAGHRLDGPMNKAARLVAKRLTDSCPRSSSVRHRQARAGVAAARRFDGLPASMPVLVDAGHGPGRPRPAAPDRVPCQPAGSGGKSTPRGAFRRSMAGRGLPIGTRAPPRGRCRADAARRRRDAGRRGAGKARGSGQAKTKLQRPSLSETVIPALSHSRPGSG